MEKVENTIVRVALTSDDNFETPEGYNVKIDRRTCMIYPSSDWYPIEIAIAVYEKKKNEDESEGK